MPLSKTERQKLGLVGKQILTDVKTGKKTITDYESENVSVLTDEEARKIGLGFGVKRPKGKNFSDVYDENGKIIAYDEIIEKDDD